MTQKLYETDGHLREFTAEVLSCVPAGDHYEVTLDRTAFFPGGGGQAADTGTIAGAEVFAMRSSGDEILHCTRQPVFPGMALCRIDWEARFRRMQRHSGEHILSGILHTEYGCTNVGFHMGHDCVTVDVDGRLSDEQLARAELLANRAVWENRPVTVSFPSPEELSSLAYRSKLELTENVRIVTVEGYDCCACCAPHVSRTGEIGLIKIRSACPNKGGTRMELLCGQDAYADYCRKAELNAEIQKLLSVRPDETASAVDKTLRELNAARFELSRLRAELVQAGLTLCRRGGLTYGCSAASCCGFAELQSCAEKLSLPPQEVCILFGQTEQGLLYFASSAQTDVRPLVQYLNRTFSGRGGGKAVYAQGRVAADWADVSAALAAAPLPLPENLL